jgi:ubiquinone/menaquinone biosynthesis C-methylase UbiE
MCIRDRLEGISFKLQKIVTPGLKPAYLLFEETVSENVSQDTFWLDLGCGHKFLAPWRENDETRLVGSARFVAGIDPNLDSLSQHRTIMNRAQATVASLPFRDSVFDLVTANMVVEHLDQPEVQFREICRVLKPGGMFVFLTPNSRNPLVAFARLVPGPIKSRLVYLVEGRSESDVYATHYRANRREDIHRIALASGFDSADITMSVSTPEFLIVPPLALLELLCIRLLMTQGLSSFRSNIIAICRKPTVNSGI